MCLAIPAKVIKMNESHAEVDIMGVRKTVNILLVDNLNVGDKIMIHAGFAISKIEDEYFCFLENMLREILDDCP
ncbi:MAG: HypC/HybG/HupF family hydrogenase formation chaperone [Eubacteriales bacterium]|jgi:hydrogenase expression/formation protein HypC|nr:HypC/HybG/HupF family hydrogenase formation chaperone [Eubacteriales bacterium]